MASTSSSIQIQVISKTITFYPLNIRNEEGLTLINSMVFLNENLGETVHSFETENDIVVLQMWNDILFKVTASVVYSKSLLLMALQVVRDTAIFLLGPRFENNMYQTIKAQQRELFARYVDKFVELCQKDYKYHLLVLESEKSISGLISHIESSIQSDFLPADDPIIECLVFWDHKLAGRIHKIDGPYLEMADVFQISLLERTQYDNLGGKNELPSVPSTGSIVHKGAFLKINGVPQQCYISAVRLGSESPMVLIFATKSPSPTAEQNERISGLTTSISQMISTQWKVDPEILPFQITGLLHYLLINRKTGEYSESSFTDQAMQHPDTKLSVLYKQMRRKMASVAMEALTSGYATVIRNEMIFQYTYNIYFIKSKNKKEPFSGEFIPPTFSSEGGISYDQLTKQNFGDDAHITCYELMTIYLGVMNTNDVVKANVHLFTQALADNKK